MCHVFGFFLRCHEPLKGSESEVKYEVARQDEYDNGCYMLTSVVTMMLSYFYYASPVVNLITLLSYNYEDDNE